MDQVLTRPKIMCYNFGAPPGREVSAHLQPGENNTRYNIGYYINIISQ